jgi:nucleotide-binding universal stress UspA family protein
LFSSALLPLDLKETYNDIVNNAAYFKELGTDKIYLIHVMTSDGKATVKAEQKIKKTASFLSKLGYKVEVIIKSGNAANVICETAAELNISIIYIPWSRKHKIRRALLGSTTRDIMRLSATPVFVHKDIPNLEDAFSGSVVFATDFTQQSLKALPYLKSLSNIPLELEILLVAHRKADPYSEEKREKQAVEKFKEIQSTLSGYFNEINFKQVIGSASKIIIKETKKTKSHLLILGRFVESFFSEMSGSTVEKIANKTPCSVLMIPE